MTDITALLAQRLGVQNVTSIEIAQLVDHARAALATAGYPISVIAGDGAQAIHLGCRMIGSSLQPRCSRCPTRGWLGPAQRG